MLYEKILSDIKDAMRNKDTERKDVLKQVQMKAQSFAKENKCEITENIVIQSINKELKQLGQTIEACKSNTESNLYLSSVRKVEILKAYLPKQMTKDECMDAVRGIVNTLPEVNGKSIGVVMKELKGASDNKIIKECFDEIMKEV